MLEYTPLHTALHARGLLTYITERQDNTQNTSPASMDTNRSKLVRVEGELEDTMMKAPHVQVV